MDPDWTWRDALVVTALIGFSALFLVSFFQLCAIQLPILAEHGWLAFAQRKVKARDVYWNWLSVGQRLRLWLGLGLFLAIFLVGSLVGLVMGVANWIHSAKLADPFGR